MPNYLIKVTETLRVTETRTAWVQVQAANEQDALGKLALDGADEYGADWTRWREEVAEDTCEYGQPEELDDDPDPMNLAKAAMEDQL